MARLQPSADPYRVLGVLRGADLEQIKAAHRRLAKLYHPDSGSGDEGRFLAVQEAYQLLTDPLRRREWDRAHAPGPVRAPSGGRAAAASSGGRAAAASSGARGPAAGDRAATGRAARSGTESRAGRRSAGSASRTWSAEHVPWWHDFRGPRRGRSEADAGQAGTPKATASAEGDGAHAGTAESADAADGVNEFDLFSRSSGAAWSSAARRHFRRGTSDLPSRGVWRYRGTQVVTGAEARKVAAEEDRGRVDADAGRDRGEQPDPDERPDREERPRR